VAACHVGSLTAASVTAPFLNMSVVTSRTSAEISELSSIIGELRNFAAQQTATNQHVIDQLKSISERINSIGETGIVLQEYRNTLHERFGKIHEHFGSLDADVEKHDGMIRSLATTQATWQANIKMIVSVAWVAGIIVSALLTNFAGPILRQILKS
jgi:hypothetical protein